MLYETNSSLKFIKKILMRPTNASNIYFCQQRFNGKYYVTKTGLKNESSTCFSQSSKDVVDELKILMRVGKHPHIVDCHDAWVEEEQFNMQLGFVVGGSLLDFLLGNGNIVNTGHMLENHTKNISDVTGFMLLAQIGSALVYMHDVLGIYHGDINPSNILVELVR